MKWTPNQDKAINLDNTNIIVSAGAGSGKTAVLTERVLRKLKEGIHINELLVLTFTNAAAESMKNRIKDKLRKETSLKEELDLLDSAYITTFDSYALSIVKTYHDYLNIEKDVKITSDEVIYLEKEKIIDDIFNELSLSNNKDFNKLINDFCLKNTDELKKYIENIYSKIELNYNRRSYLEEYIKNTFNNKNLNIIKDSYLELINTKKEYIKEIINSMNNIFDDKYLDKLNIHNFLNSRTYEELKSTISFEIPRLPNKSTDEMKNLKESLKKVQDDIKELLIYKSTDEMIEELLDTKSNIETLTNILLELDKRITDYKINTSTYNYTDIAHMAMKVIKENDDVREEVKDSFNEILIDEYQDTSDIQEEFISLISNNNVYMVGDIKQSIYRFRNANPHLFQSKYDDYKNELNGKKIDLLENFRSNSDTINLINNIFTKLMTNTYGGANYLDDHIMVYGNHSYDNFELDKPVHFITYNEEKDYTNSEIEAFSIGSAIKEHIKNNYQIFDDGKYRKVKYSDYTILIDRSKDFDLYKKIFDYLKIPLQVIRDTKLTKDNDLLIIRNLFNLLIHIKDNNLDSDFVHSYVSISRSFLYKTKDEDIYNTVINKSYKESSLYKKCLNLIDKIDIMTPSNYYNLVLDEFNYDEKLIEIGDIEPFLVREEYLYNLIKDFSTNGNTIYDFIKYIDDIYEKEIDIRFKTNLYSSNSVTIMTIHNSKGLEFPICFYPGLTSKFNMQDIKDRIFYDNKYGIIAPYVNNYYKDTILKTLVSQNEKKESISEYIRLFYVALTRAKQQIIIMLPKDYFSNNYSYPGEYKKEKYMKYADIFKTIKLDGYVAEEHDIELTKDYLKDNIKEKNKEITLPSDKLKVLNIDLNKDLIENDSFSKESNTILNKELLERGTKVHEILELLDFKNPDYSNIDNNLVEDIKYFLNTDLIKDNINNNMYKEYEFIYEEESSELHGIIDLLIDSNDKFIIIDYKLKGIDDSNYDKQLNGYRKYIKNEFNKDVECYLYSIIDRKYRKVNE